VEPKKVPRILAAGPTGELCCVPGDPYRETPELGTLRVCLTTLQTSVSRGN